MKMDISGIKYRKVRENETSILVEYRMRFLRELQGPQTPDREIYVKGELTEYFNSALVDGSFIAWIAEINHQPIGFGGMVIQRIPAHFHLINGLQGYILNMYTIPEHRKKGVGAEILKRLVDDGRKIGLTRIYLNSTKAGIEIYKRNGFKIPEFPELELLDF